MFAVDKPDGAVASGNQPLQLTDTQGCTSGFSNGSQNWQANRLIDLSTISSWVPSPPPPAQAASTRYPTSYNSGTRYPTSYNSGGGTGGGANSYQGSSGQTRYPTSYPTAFPTMNYGSSGSSSTRYPTYSGSSGYSSTRYPTYHS